MPIGAVPVDIPFHLEKQKVLQIICISHKNAKDNKAERDKEGWLCSV